MALRIERDQRQHDAYHVMSGAERIGRIEAERVGFRERWLWKCFYYPRDIEAEGKSWELDEARAAVAAVFRAFLTSADLCEITPPPGGVPARPDYLRLLESGATPRDLRRFRRMLRG